MSDLDRSIRLYRDLLGCEVSTAGPMQVAQGGPVGGVKVVYVRDPDGVVLELIEEPPGVTLENIYFG